MALKLKLEDGSGVRTVPLEAPMVLGRSESADIPLEEPLASREHLKLRPVAGGAIASDLGSKNGTWLGEDRVVKARLRPGDRIRIGETHLTLVDGGPPPRAAERTPLSRTLLAVFAPPLVLLLLFQAGLYAVNSSRQEEIGRAQRRLELAELRLASRSAERDPADALAHLEAFVRRYGSSSYAADAEAEIVALRPRVERIAAARRELAELEKIGGELAFSELRYRYEKLLGAYSDLPVVSREVGEALKALDHTHRESLEGMVNRVRAEATELLARGEYGRALSYVTSFNERSPAAASAYADEIRSVETEVLEKAEEAYHDVLARSEALIEEGKAAEGVALLREEAPRFMGTRFNAFLRLRAESLGRRSRKTEEKEKAESLLAQRRNYYLLAQEAEELAAAGLFLRAADKYAAILGSIRIPEIREEFSVREGELRALSGLVAKVRKGIEEAGSEFGLVRFGKRGFRVKGLRGDQLLLEYKGQAVERSWGSLSPEELLELMRRSKLTSRDQLTVAVFCFDQNLRVAWYAEILAALEREDLREEAGRVYARREGVPYPEGGFVSYRDRIMTRAERAEEMHREQVTGLRQQWEKLHGKFRGHPAFGKRFAKLATLREDLEEARKHALKLIFDETRYFYPKTKDLAKYEEVQKEVDLRVAAVREIWDNPLTVTVRQDSSLKGVLADIDEVREELIALGVDTTEADRSIALLTMYIGRTLTIRTFFKDEDEAARLEYDRKVLEWNAAVETIATKLERKQVLVTNQYRMMLGRRAVWIDDILVKTGRGHSDEMSREGYFSHFSPHPERRTPDLRAKLEGYKGGVISENIHRGAGTPEGAHSGWIHSSGHHRNLLQPFWTQMGVGMVANYWTQMFGRTKLMTFPEQSGDEKK